MFYSAVMARVRELSNSGGSTAAALVLPRAAWFPRTAIDNLIYVSFVVAPRAVVPMEQAHHWNGKHSLDVSSSTRNAI